VGKLKVRGNAGRARRRCLDDEYAELDARSRRQALTHQESVRLEKIIKEIDARNAPHRTTPRGDRRFRENRV
jgi:hypothetical protein